ncbi:hypothetical protein V1523DRAFT_174128 [Lipomyces doorenjongii]
MTGLAHMVNIGEDLDNFGHNQVLQRLLTWYVTTELALRSASAKQWRINPRWHYLLLGLILFFCHLGLQTGVPPNASTTIDLSELLGPNSDVLQVLGMLRLLSSAVKVSHLPVTDRKAINNSICLVVFRLLS